LQGRYHWNRRTEEGLKEGIEYFKKAIALDPTFALAYAGVADCYSVLGSISAYPHRLAFPIAGQMASKALELDETLAEVHTSLATISAVYAWDWPTAEREYQRAIELNRGYATAHHWHANLLAVLGRFEEAFPRFRKAQELDPLSPIISANLGKCLYFARRYDEAREQLERTLVLDANFSIAHSYLGLVYEQMGEHEKAITAFQQAVLLSGRAAGEVAALAHAYALAGRSKDSQELLGELTGLPDTRYVPPFFIALVYLGLGKVDQTFAWLGKAHGERSFDLLELQVDPRFDGIRSDPRFDDLLEKMNLHKNSKGKGTQLVSRADQLAIQT
jgi:tetratricopeptide (TPR) repeat protein